MKLFPDNQTSGTKRERPESEAEMGEPIGGWNG